MKSQIVKIKDDNLDGYVSRYIFGLTLLPDDHSQYGSIYDPRLNFLREVSRRQSVSALIDKGCGHILDSDPLFSHTSYRVIPVGVMGGEFIRYPSLTDATSLFFPKIKDDFFDIT